MTSAASRNLCFFCRYPNVVLLDARMVLLRTCLADSASLKRSNDFGGFTVSPGNETITNYKYLGFHPFEDFATPRIIRRARKLYELVESWDIRIRNHTRRWGYGLSQKVHRLLSRDGAK